MSADAEAPHGLGWRFGYRLAGFVPFAAVSAVQLVTKFSDDTPLDHVTKALEMPTLALGAALALIGSKWRPRLAVILTLAAGLLFSWLGDVFLGDAGGEFRLGLGFFFAAHLAYIAMFELAFHRRRPSWWALLAIPWFVALVILLAPSLGGMLVLVIVYGAALGLMAVSATRGSALTAAGGVLFVASDSFLAFRMFTPLFGDDLSEFLIMLSYLAAQALIVTGMLRAAETAPQPAGR